MTPQDDRNITRALRGQQQAEKQCRCSGILFDLDELPDYVASYPNGDAEIVFSGRDYDHDMGDISDLERVREVYAIPGRVQWTSFSGQSEAVPLWVTGARLLLDHLVVSVEWGDR